MNKFLGGIAFGFVLLAFSTRSVFAADWYVSTTGSSGNSGSISSPWDLPSALFGNASIHAGDTVWLRAGTYNGNFTAWLAGNSSDQITFRNYNNERVILDGGLNTNATLTMGSSNQYVTFWGLEFSRTDTNRTSAQTGSVPTDIYIGNAITIQQVAGAGVGNKYINLIIHDNNQSYGIWSESTQAEIYGNLIYHNGWQAPDRGHGHGIYCQNQTGSKTLKDNIIFNQSGWGIHCYGVNAYFNNFNIQGNILFNNGAIDTPSQGYNDNILVGGEVNVAQDDIISNNYTYFDAVKSGGQNEFGYSAGCNNGIVQDNYFVSSYRALLMVNCTNLTMTGNTFVGTVTNQNSFPLNTYYDSSSPPTHNVVFVRPNSYESGRGHVAVYNWESLSSVNVDLSSVLDANQAYEIYDVQNYFGSPIATGTYSGSGYVSIPMTSTTVSTVVGLSTPPHTSTQFGSFVVKGGAISASPSPSPTPTPTSGSSGTAQTDYSTASPIITTNGGSASMVSLPTIKLSPTATGKTTISGVQETALHFSGKGASGAVIKIIVTSETGRKIPGSTIVGMNGVWSWEPPVPLAKGDYSGLFSIQDKQGNTGTVTIKFTVESDTKVSISESKQERLPSVAGASNEVTAPPSFLEKVILYVRRMLKK